VRALTVTIVDHNHGAWLPACLRSLEDHPYTLGPFDVVVVDNASEDGSADEIASERVRVLRQAVRRGFGANQNIAAAVATGDLIFLLNPDAAVGEGTLDRLASALESHQTAVIAAGPVIEADQPPSRPRKYPTPGGAFSKAIGIERIRRSPGQTEAVLDDAWVSGAAFMVRKDRFVEAGGFDESFFLYSEEVDLMRRLTKSGGTVAWVPDAVTTHAGKTSEAASTHTDMPTRTWVQFARGEMRYMRKHHGRIGEALFRVGALLDAAIRYLATFVPGLRGSMYAKGPSPAHTRAHHLTRLHTFAFPSRGDDMEAAAAAWNARHIGLSRSP
jgi:N-acetylglucosaminyl-diphospho-decaprenol L-rhamnosyltransferase